jgi:hypothetical protein
MKKYFILIIGIVIILLVGITLQKDTDETIQSHRSYDVNLLQDPKIDLNQPTVIKYEIKNDKGEIVKDFAIAHEKIMHFIIVRKDLTQFQHLHPNFNQETGEFNLNLIFAEQGPYRFFADFTPAQDNPQKLPLAVLNDLSVGDLSNYKPEELILDTTKEKIVSDYKITYTFPNEIKSTIPITYSLLIEQNNQPIILENYLGALGHSIILKETTLTYIHTHVGQNVQSHGQTTNSQESNKVDFSAVFPEPGIYKIFSQFQYQGKVITTDYTIQVN